MRYVAVDGFDRISGFTIRSEYSPFDGSLILHTDQDAPSGHYCIRFESFEVKRTINESFNHTRYSDMGSWDQIPIVQVLDSAWVRELEQQTFEGCLDGTSHYLIWDEEWVYDVISRDPPSLGTMNGSFQPPGG